jgi:hypothetical protein
MTDNQNPYLEKKIEKRASIEGFRRNEVDWKEVASKAQGMFPTKVNIQSGEDNKPYVAKVGKQVLNNPIPLDYLGTNPQDKKSTKIENKLIGLYRDATKSYTPPIHKPEQKPSQQYSEKSQMMERVPKEDRINRMKANLKEIIESGLKEKTQNIQREIESQRMERERQSIQERQREHYLQAQMQSKYDKGGFDPSSNVFHQARPRDIALPPVLKRRFSPY